MNKINYQKELDRIIEQNRTDGVTPELLLHVCCAPCSSYCLEYLSEHFDITVYYYNPNISPESEYRFRLSEEERYISLREFKNPVSITESVYDPREFFDAVQGLEREPEGAFCSSRVAIIWSMVALASASASCAAFSSPVR